MSLDLNKFFINFSGVGVIHVWLGEDFLTSLKFQKSDENSVEKMMDFLEKIEESKSHKNGNCLKLCFKNKTICFYGVCAFFQP